MNTEIFDSPAQKETSLMGQTKPRHGNNGPNYNSCLSFRGTVVSTGDLFGAAAWQAARSPFVQHSVGAGIPAGISLLDHDCKGKLLHL